MCHRAGSALIHERAIVESEYKTEMFSACFDFDSAPLTAVASLAPVCIARNSRRGRVEGLVGATLHLEEMGVEETVSSLAEKNWRGDPLVSAGTVCYAEKEENIFGSVR